MNEAKVLHHQAMEFADAAVKAKLDGDVEGAAILLRKAFEHEQRAANSCVVEPSRSILQRSAASLAIECGLSEKLYRPTEARQAFYRGTGPDHGAL